MIGIVYAGFGLALVLLVGFFCAIIVASAMDWYHYRRNRLWIELQRDHSKPRRPAAK
jgi:hypothetical protein